MFLVIVRNQFDMFPSIVRTWDPGGVKNNVLRILRVYLVTFVGRQRKSIMYKSLIEKGVLAPVECRTSVNSSFKAINDSMFNLDCSFLVRVEKKHFR